MSDGITADDLLDEFVRLTGMQRGTIKRKLFEQIPVDEKWAAEFNAKVQEGVRRFYDGCEDTEAVSRRLKASMDLLKFQAGGPL